MTKIHLMFNSASRMFKVAIEANGVAIEIARFHTGEEAVQFVDQIEKAFKFCEVPIERV